MKTPPLLFRLVHGLVDTFIGTVVFWIFLMPFFSFVSFKPSPTLLLFLAPLGVSVFRIIMIWGVSGTFAHGITSCRVRSVLGKKLEVGMIVRRSLAQLAPWDIFSYRNGTFWHDRCSHTILVRVPREKHTEDTMWLNF